MPPSNIILIIYNYLIYFPFIVNYLKTITHKIITLYEIQDQRSFRNPALPLERR